MTRSEEAATAAAQGPIPAIIALEAISPALLYAQLNVEMDSKL